MKASQTPFPRGWPAIALDGLGFDELRGNRGTYGLYDFDSLPALPDPTGDFRWLDGRPDAPEWSIRGADEDAIRNANNLERLLAARLALPESFVTFLGTPALQAKVRSSTACFLSLCPVPVDIPQGRLVRFLSDQQGCLYWYLFLAPDGEHAILASPDFFGAPEEQWEEESDEPEPEPRGPWFCGEIFEGFLHRYWLENEIAFAYSSSDYLPVIPMPTEADDYLAAYRARAAALRSEA